ncbi:hypothetical protein CPC08DRAFT_712180 [Agrocybe pediades]|nr:hypothetical protein CPC08DRAFT_712180 [Agrocybe pediades]
MDWGSLCNLATIVHSTLASLLYSHRQLAINQERDFSFYVSLCPFNQFFALIPSEIQLDLPVLSKLCAAHA